MLSNFGAILVRFAGRFKGEEGQALAEYSLILTFVALACILAVGALGLAVSGQLDGITSALP
jgi:Flp pilus assembly pilin Flp